MMNKYVLKIGPNSTLRGPTPLLLQVKILAKFDLDNFYLANCGFKQNI